MNSLGKKTFILLYITSIILSVTVPSIASNTQKTKKVVFVRYNLKNESSPPSAVLTEFKKTMQNRGYEEGKDIEYIDFVTHLPERKSAKKIMAFVETHKQDADIFITNSWTSLYARSILAKTDVPQLFVPALKSTALNMLPSLETEPGTNLSGIYLSHPPEKILRLIKSVLPKVKKYGFVYDSRIPADIHFKAAYGQLNVHERNGITIYYLDLANGVEMVLRKMNKIGIEVFGGVVGAQKNISALTKSNLPMITVLLFDRDRESLIKTIKDTNFIAGLYSPFGYCGRQAADMTADIFDGESSIKKLIPLPARQFSIINLYAAKKLNRSIPLSALEAAEIVIK